MVNDGKNDLDGIRISVPLSKIDHIDEGNRLAFTYFLSVYLPKEFDAPYDDFKKNKLQFGTIRPEAEWRRLEHHITVAKGRNSPNVASNIVLDFGPLSFSPSYLHSDIASVVTPTDKEMTIRLALALGDEPRIWCTYLILLSLPLAQNCLEPLRYKSSHSSHRLFSWIFRRYSPPRLFLEQDDDVSGHPLPPHYLYRQVCEFCWAEFSATQWATSGCRGPRRS